MGRFMRVAPKSTHRIIALGNVYQKTKQFDEALCEFSRSLKIAEEINSPPMIADSKRALGNLARMQSRWNEAEKHLLEAIGIYQKMQNNFLESLTLCDLANLSQDKADPEAAAKLYAKALSIFPNDGLILIQWAEHLIKAGERDQAKNVLIKAQKTHAEHPDLIRCLDSVAN